MSIYEELVTQAQMNYSNYYGVYSQGGTAVRLSQKEQLPYEEQIKAFAAQVKEAECIIVGGASGLSAAGGGDFYYGDTPSFRKYFGRFAEKYGIKGAFNGTFRKWESREEYWAFLATFLHTTITAPVREPYRDLDAVLRGKEFFILTTNQDTQFVKLYPENRVAQIQGDHRFFQCKNCCTDDTWDSTKAVNEMYASLGEDKTAIPTELIPKCPHCGGEVFPWVRGYGNFLQGTRYYNEYKKMSDYIEKNADKKLLFIELGVGRMTPMFIQEPFWSLTLSIPDARYISVNAEYAYLPQQIENKGMAMKNNIAQVLRDVKAETEKMQ